MSLLESDKVVYILGAGFSAPAGIPVMANFREKMDDLFLQDRDLYKHFENVLKQIKDMGRIHEYFETDLHNIEEILSILEMFNYINPEDKSLVLQEDVQNLIKDVIKHYDKTMDVEPGKFDTYDLCTERKWLGIGSGGTYTLSSVCNRNVVGYSGSLTPYELYFKFVNMLLGELQVWDKSKKEKVYDSSKHFMIEGDFKVKDSNVDIGISTSKTAKYCVLSLNYDLIIQSHLNVVNSLLEGLLDGFSDKHKEQINARLNYAPLHGTIDTEIVPPTWKKVQPRESDLHHHWQHAGKWLTEATHIRILGYSFPKTDTYMRYLLEASLMNNTRIKKIDVISLDNDGKLREYYESIFRFKNFRFKNARIEDYLNQPHIEGYHDRFMSDDKAN